MFTELTSLHLLQSTSITNTGLERPIYASYGGRRKKGEKKKTSSASMKIIGKKSSRSIASSQQHYVCMLIIISTLTKFPIFSPNTFAEQMPDLNCSPQMYICICEYDNWFSFQGINKKRIKQPDQPAYTCCIHVCCRYHLSSNLLTKISEYEEI